MYKIIWAPHVISHCATKHVGLALHGSFLGGAEEMEYYYYFNRIDGFLFIFFNLQIKSDTSTIADYESFFNRPIAYKKLDEIDENN